MRPSKPPVLHEILAGRQATADKNGPLIVLGIVAGYAVVRHPRCAPFLLTARELIDLIFAAGEMDKPDDPL